MGKAFKILICLSVLGFCIYVGYLFGMPFYKYKVFQSDTMDIVRYELPRIDDIHKRIVKKAKEIGVPIRPEDIRVTEGRFKYSATAQWTETVNLFDQYEHTYSFEFDTSYADQ